ncbi:MAG TPA: histidine kinase [Methylophilaceae bacterium]
MSLKLRLNLIITGLLLLIMLAGMLLNIVNARQNVRAEVESTEKLALYLFDTGILNNPGAVLREPEKKPLRLQSLRHMRHVRIEFLDIYGHILDSNRAGELSAPQSEAPAWFEDIMDKVTPKWEPLRRDIEYQGRLLGHLVITPDPSSEYAEIWKQITDLMTLLSIFFVTVNLMVYWAVGQALKPTARILEALNSLERGDLEARLPHFDLPELARIGEKFNHMVETLQQSIMRNHRLSQQLISLQEEERKSLARDLHDEFGQCLTAINADATVVLQLAEKKYPEIRDSAQAIAKLSRHLMDLVSGLMQRLRPGILDELGLASALQDLVDTWRLRNETVNCKLTIDDGIYKDQGMNEVIQITIYRLVQECLTNISRHARATQVEITLNSKPGNGPHPMLYVNVSDNGKGFNEAAVDGFGLHGMRERVEGLGGVFTLVTRLGKGTEISARIPLQNNVLKDS